MRKKIIFNIISKILFLIILITFIIVSVKLPDCLTTHYVIKGIKGIKLGNTGLYLNFNKLKSETIDYYKLLLSCSFGITSKNKPVWDYIRRGFPMSITLLISSLILSIIFGVIKGIFDSKKHKSYSSNAKLLSTITFLSIPDVFLIILFQGIAIWLYRNGIEFLPAAGNSSLKHAILPILTLSIIPTNYIARITSLSFDDIYEKEYIKTAIGKGASNLRIIWI